MPKFRTTEELLSIISSVAEVFPWPIEVNYDGDKTMELKSVTVVGINPGYSRDLIFRFLEVSSDGYGEAQIFVKRADGKEEDMNEYIQFRDVDEFKDAVKRIHKHGPNGLDWWEYRFGKTNTNCWTDDVFNIIPC